MTALARANWALLLVPGGLLLGALAFQHLGGLAPCEMCIWQRWPHALAIAAAVGALALPAARRPLLVLAALAVLASGAIGAFHVGVEQGWWPSPTGCASTSLGEGDFASAIIAAPIIRCDAVPWSLAGISMAGWNAIISAAAAVIALSLVAVARSR